jgi:hypothetical protein
MSHFLFMVIYAAIISTFFTVLWKREPRQQLKLFLQLFFGLVVGAVALAWLMYPFPSGPPTPIP